jgi:hypothetical protein
MSVPPDFWANRRHYVIGALVGAGAFPGISIEAYQAKLHEGMSKGLQENFACMYALDYLLESRQIPSACEVNPW